LKRILPPKEFGEAVKFLSLDADDVPVILFVKHCSSSTTWHSLGSAVDVAKVQHLSAENEWATLRLRTMARQSAQLEMLNDTGGFSRVSRSALAQADW